MKREKERRKEKRDGAPNPGVKWLEALSTVNVEKHRAIRMAVISNELIKITTQLFDMKEGKRYLLAILYEASNRDKKEARGQMREYKRQGGE